MIERDRLEIEADRILRAAGDDTGRIVEKAQVFNTTRDMPSIPRAAFTAPRAPVAKTLARGKLKRHYVCEDCNSPRSVSSGRRCLNCYRAWLRLKCLRKIAPLAEAGSLHIEEYVVKMERSAWGEAMGERTF